MCLENLDKILGVNGNIGVARKLLLLINRENFTELYEVITFLCDNECFYELDCIYEHPEFITSYLDSRRRYFNKKESSPE